MPTARGDLEPGDDQGQKRLERCNAPRNCFRGVLNPVRKIPDFGTRTIRGGGKIPALVFARSAGSLPGVDEQQAIDLYNRAGFARGRGTCGVQWPDLALDPENVERVAEGVLGARANLAEIALGNDVDLEAGEFEIEERWRTDRLAVRFAPEGVMVRAAFTVAFVLGDQAVDQPRHARETLSVEGEFCLSHTELHGVCPVVDFLRGEACRRSDQARTRLDPFTLRLDPVSAVAWGLNGVDNLS